MGNKYKGAEDYQKRYWLENKAKLVKRRKERREEIRVQQRAYTLSYMAIPEKRIYKLAYRAILRASKLGMAVDKNLPEVLAKTPPMTCLCCKSDLDYSTGRGRADRDNSPSLDRFDSRRGYTIDNVVVICYRCNTLKKDGAIEEFENILRYMRGEHGTNEG
jgi:hypothetical protein